jgi:hypothetical protein
MYFLMSMRWSIGHALTQITPEQVLVHVIKWYNFDSIAYLTKRNNKKKRQIATSSLDCTGLWNFLVAWYGRFVLPTQEARCSLDAVLYHLACGGE